MVPPCVVLCHSRKSGLWTLKLKQQQITIITPGSMRIVLCIHRRVYELVLEVQSWSKRWWWWRHTCRNSTSSSTCPGSILDLINKSEDYSCSQRWSWHTWVLHKISSTALFSILGGKTMQKMCRKLQVGLVMLVLWTLLAMSGFSLDVAADHIPTWLSP